MPLLAWEVCTAVSSRIYTDSTDFTDSSNTPARTGCGATRDDFGRSEETVTPIPASRSASNNLFTLNVLYRSLARRMFRRKNDRDNRIWRSRLKVER